MTSGAKDAELRKAEQRCFAAMGERFATDLKRMYGTIAPALTAAQWEEARQYTHDFAGGGGADIVGVAFGRHALAAVALDGQPFGFNRGDVRMLRNHGERIKHQPMIDLAARIEALLPPLDKELIDEP